MTETARKRTRTVEQPEYGNIDKCTCFVRRVPKDVGENELLEVFGAIGPVKKAFIVQDKDEERHKGYAFVNFALPDDAKKAVRELANHSLHGSKLKVEPAQRRVPLAERHKPGDNENTPDDSGATGGSAKHRRGTMSASQKAELCKAIAIGGMSSQQVEAVVAKAKGLGSVTSVDEVPVVVASIAKLKQDGCPDGAILVHYSSVKEAMEAVLQLHRFKLKVAGQSVVLWARQVNGEGANVKQWRLIIRNLPFSVDEPELIKFVGEAAMVWGASIPKHSSGKKKGFGFVSFTCRAHALKAMEHVNAKKLRNRVLVADWSIPKNEFNTPASGQDADVPAAGSTDPTNTQKPAAAPEARGEDSEGESDEEINAAVGDVIKHTGRTSSDAPGVAGGAPDSNVGTESEDPETLSYAALHVKPGEQRMYEDMLANVLSEKGAADKAAKKASQSKTKALLPDESEQEGTQPKDGKKVKKDQKTTKPADWEGERSEAVGGGADDGSGLIQRQVFVRNLSLDVLSSELSSCMQKFGEVKACRLVLNKSTGKPKGTAFVEFQEPKAAAAACKACAMEREGNGEGVRLRSRVLAVDAALVQDKARSLAFELGKGSQASSGTGKRNLHLVKEGRIEQGSELWAQLSERDQRKRLNSIKEVNLKLKSSNFFISPTRLRMMNVPIAWDNNQLKVCCIKAVRERATQAEPKVSQCVILRDTEKKDAKGQAKSRGCAFVEFESHEHALVCLRQMNNNPALFGGKPARPIVEFAVENVRALKIQQKKRKAVEDMKQQRSMAELAPGEEAEGQKKSKKRKRSDKSKEPAAASGEPKGTEASDQGTAAQGKLQNRKRAQEGGLKEDGPATQKGVDKDKKQIASKHAEEHVLPTKSAKQELRASRKRPNKRTPANADDLDRALSMRAKQLFNGINL